MTTQQAIKQCKEMEAIARFEFEKACFETAIKQANKANQPQGGAN
jgi:hypothetical protein